MMYKANVVQHFNILYCAPRLFLLGKFIILNKREAKFRNMEIAHVYFQHSRYIVQFRRINVSYTKLQKDQIGRYSY